MTKTLYVPDYIAHVGDSDTLFGFSGADTYIHEITPKAKDRYKKMPLANILSEIQRRSITEKPTEFTSSDIL